MVGILLFRGTKVAKCNHVAIFKVSQLKQVKSNRLVQYRLILIYLPKGYSSGGGHFINICWTTLSQ